MTPLRPVEFRDAKQVVAAALVGLLAQNAPDGPLPIDLCASRARVLLDLLSPEAVAELRRHEEWIERSRTFENDVYRVMARSVGPISPGGPPLIQLFVDRLDLSPVHSWADMQTIKDELLGPEVEAIELYPARSRLINSSNTYILWAVLDPEIRWPIEMHDLVPNPALARLLAARSATE